MNNIVYKLSIPIYEVALRVTFSRPKWVKSDTCSGATRLDGNVITVYIKNDNGEHINANTLAHESFHVADFLCDMIGMEMNRGQSNEHIAYLIGWLSNEIARCFELWLEANRSYKLKS